MGRIGHNPDARRLDLGRGVTAFGDGPLGHVVRTGTSDDTPFKHFRGGEPPRFAHPSELELAQLLDASGIPWLYEPHTFVLEQDDDGNVVEAFTPDFYLPEQDLYVEITIMKQSLVTRKNRKLRKLRDRYPDVNVKLFYKRDVARLAERFKLPIAS